MLLLHTTCHIKKRTSRRFERAFLFSSETSGPSPPFGLGLYCSDSFATISLMCGSLMEAIISPSCIPGIGLTLVFSLVPVEPWIPIQTYIRTSITKLARKIILKIYIKCIFSSRCLTELKFTNEWQNLRLWKHHNCQFS